MTTLQELIEKIREAQDKYIELGKKNKDLKVGVDAVLTATTLISMQAHGLLEKERQQIAHAYELGCIEEMKETFKTGKEFYESVYENPNE